MGKPIYEKPSKPRVDGSENRSKIGAGSSRQPATSRLSLAFDPGRQQEFDFALPARDLELDLDGVVGPQVQGHSRRRADRLHHVRKVVQREEGPNGLFGLQVL